MSGDVTFREASAIVAKLDATSLKQISCYSLQPSRIHQTSLFHLTFLDPTVNIIYRQALLILHEGTNEHG